MASPKAVAESVVAGSGVPAAGRHVALLRALRMVIRADSDPARQALFASLLSSRMAVRVVYRLHDRLRGTWGSALLVAAFGLAAFGTIVPPRARRARVLAVARHENARRHVARVCSWIGPDECAMVRSGPGALLRWSTLACLATLVSAARVRRSLRIIRALDDRHGFLVSCRISAALAWYARSRAILRDHKPGAVLVSSDSNPEEVGFIGAARALGVPQVFVSHAYPTPLSPPLDFTLSILEGEAAVRARRRKGPITGEVLLAGIEGEYAPLDRRRFERPNPTIGIFTSKAISWPTMAEIIDDCRRHLHPRRIIIRWHPSMLERPQLANVLADMSAVVESPASAPLAEVARQCDWVIADENSNVHLPVLKLGIPTVAIKHLGVYPDSHADQYGFAANGVIFPPVASIREVRAEALADFFASGWQARFEQYDASYLRADEAVGRDVRRAIGRLLS